MPCSLLLLSGSYVNGPWVLGVLGFQSPSPDWSPGAGGLGPHPNFMRHLRRLALCPKARSPCILAVGREDGQWVSSNTGRFQSRRGRTDGGGLRVVDGAETGLITCQGLKMFRCSQSPCQLGKNMAQMRRWKREYRHKWKDLDTNRPHRTVTRK